MRLLVLGGTVFLGRHLVADALARGWDVTIANRGQTDPAGIGGVPQLRIDRAVGDLAALRDVEADVVVDTSAYRPGVVADALAALDGSVGRYCLISTCSVYAQPLAPGTGEDAPREALPADVDPATVDVMERYGALKAACEDVAFAALGPRALVIRPGLIVGPDDPTDRFTYWPRRLARGGRVLAGEPDQPVQVIDVRDLAALVLDASAAGADGAVNALGPTTPITFADVVEACAQAAGAAADIAWAGEAFLRAHGVEQWMGLPLWLERAEWAFSQFDVARAVELGLRCRPLVETAADTLAWDRTRPAEARLDRLAPAREAQLLTLLP